MSDNIFTNFCLDEALKNVDPDAPLTLTLPPLEKCATLEISYNAYPAKDVATAMTRDELKRHLFMPRVTVIEQSRP